MVVEILKMFVANSLRPNLTVDKNSLILRIRQYKNRTCRFLRFGPGQIMFARNLRDRLPEDLDMMLLCPERVFSIDQMDRVSIMAQSLDELLSKGPSLKVILGCMIR